MECFPTQDPEPGDTAHEQPHHPDDYDEYGPEGPDGYDDEFDPDDGATPPEPDPDAEPTPLYTVLSNQYGPASFTTMTDTHGRTLEVTTIHAPADRFATVRTPAPDTILTL